MSHIKFCSYDEGVAGELERAIPEAAETIDPVVIAALSAKLNLMARSLSKEEADIPKLHHGILNAAQKTISEHHQTIDYFIVAPLVISAFAFMINIPGVGSAFFVPGIMVIIATFIFACIVLHSRWKHNRWHIILQDFIEIKKALNDVGNCSRGDMQ